MKCIWDYGEEIPFFTNWKRVKKNGMARNTREQVYELIYFV